jgi:hypothetical protein
MARMGSPVRFRRARISVATTGFALTALTIDAPPVDGELEVVSISCLGDNCPYSAQTAPVGSSQVTLGRDSGQCGLVGCSCGLWNDRENDRVATGRSSHISSFRGYT